MAGLLSRDALPMPEALPEYLRDAAARPFRYGAHDCFLFSANWCARVRAIDPGARIRGRYGSLTEGLALAGVKNLPMAFARLFRRAGLLLTGAPVLGDIALISIAGSDARGAIVTATGYVVLGETLGLSRLPLTAARRLAAWSVDA